MEEKEGIKSDFMTNSFRKSNITLKMDGSEGNFFQYPDEFDLDFKIIDDDNAEGNKEESDFENDCDSLGQ